MDEVREVRRSEARTAIEIHEASRCRREAGGREVLWFETELGGSFHPLGRKQKTKRRGGPGQRPEAHLP